MRNLSVSTALLAVSLLYAASTHAEDSQPANVFAADMSNPDLAAIITSFQDVCLPFIVHTTELPQSLNQQHHVKLLMQQGFEFKSRARLEDRYITNRSNGALKPPSKALNPAHKFTIFNIPKTEGEFTQTRVEQTGEINWHNWMIPDEYKTITRDIDRYVLKDDARQTASLGWSYASQNHPGKSCEMTLDTTTLPLEVFQSDFIERDPDWKPSSSRKARWVQCTRDGTDEFRFTAEIEMGNLTLSVRRNDFYETQLCTKYDLSAQSVSKPQSVSEPKTH